MPKNFILQAIVLNRKNFRDADRFITAFSLEQGKQELLAKGVRKLTSKKRPALEIGNHLKLHCVQGHYLPVITQTQLLHSFPQAKTNLTRITQLYQVLEIINHLTVPGQTHPQIYHQLVFLLEHLNQPGNQKPLILDSIRSILVELGFGLPESNSELDLKLHLEEIIQHPLKSKQFLNPSTSHLTT